MSPEQTSRHEKIFDLFSQSHTRTVEVSDLRKVLLLAGHTVTPTEVRDLVSPAGRSSISLEEFLEMCERLSRTDITKEELRRAFECMDPENQGHVPLQQLVDILKEGENKLSASEIEELVGILEPDANGRVNYGALIRELYEKSPMGE